MVSAFHPIKPERMNDLCHTEPGKIIPIDMVTDMGKKRHII